jgi:hypothetical protein
MGFEKSPTAGGGDLEGASTTSILLFLFSKQLPIFAALHL